MAIILNRSVRVDSCVTTFRVLCTGLFTLASVASSTAAASPNFSNRTEVSKAIGVPKDSRFYSSFFDRASDKSSITPNNKLSQAEVTSAVRVIRHYRGTEGQPFTPPPSKEQTLAASRLKAADVKKILSIAKDAWKLPLEVLPTPQKIMPTCLISKTEKLSIPKTPKTQPNQLIFDYLFIQKDDTPIDPAKAFGKRTSVFEYETIEHASAYLAMAVKATCLPYRIRVTGKNIYRHYGLNALYNFDQQYDGRGKLDKSIADKFRKGTK